jgi:hypothetical protein
VPELEREKVRLLHQRQQDSLNSLQALETKLDRSSFDTGEIVKGSKLSTRKPTTELMLCALPTSSPLSGNTCHLQRDSKLTTDDRVFSDYSEASESDATMIGHDNEHLSLEQLANAARHVENPLRRITLLQKGCETDQKSKAHKVHKMYERFCSQWEATVTSTPTAPLLNAKHETKDSSLVFTSSGKRRSISHHYRKPQYIGTIGSKRTPTFLKSSIAIASEPIPGQIHYKFLDLSDMGTRDCSLPAYGQCSTDSVDMGAMPTSVSQQHENTPGGALPPPCNPHSKQSFTLPQVLEENKTDQTVGAVSGSQDLYVEPWQSFSCGSHFTYSSGHLPIEPKSFEDTAIPDDTTSNHGYIFNDMMTMESDMESSGRPWGHLTSLRDTAAHSGNLRTTVRPAFGDLKAPRSEDDRVSQQMALLLMMSDQRPSPNANSATFRIDLPEGTEQYERVDCVDSRPGSLSEQ